MARIKHWGGALRRHSTSSRKPLLSCEIKKESQLVKVDFADGNTALFHSQWLYHNSPAHAQPGSGQRATPLQQLARPPALSAAAAATDGTLVVTWADGSAASFTAAWLRRHDYSDGALARAAAAAAPPCLTAAAPRPGGGALGKAGLPTHACADLLGDDAAVLRWLRDLDEWGIALVTGAGVAGGTAARLAARIAPPMRTLYGTEWDVEVQPGVAPINIAYTPASLDVHIDLAYYESPPGLQLLHCRAFDDAIAGGESTFVDGVFAAEELRRRHPRAFDTLARVPATFQKVHYERAEPAHMVRQRPHVTVEPGGAPGAPAPVTSVTWAPAFEGPLRVPPGDVTAYYDAYAHFARLLAEFEVGGAHLIEFRLAPGDVVVFNNRRMLHGRRHFYAAGGAAAPPRRALQGCYVGVDDWRSRLLTLGARLGGARGLDGLRRVGDHQVELLT